MKNSYYLKTLGCRVNQAESIEIEKNLQKAGFLPVKKGRKPDLVIINSCAVTQKAENQVKQLARSYKRKRPDSLLVIAGCVAVHWQKIGSKRLDFGGYQGWTLKGYDLLIPNQQKSQIAQIITTHLKIKTESPDVNHLFEPAFLPYWPSGRALVKIQDGCQNFCAYCLVPHLRNQIKSKPIPEIIKEINSLIRQRGIKEVVLCGINLELYQSDLAPLLKQILKKTKIKRIRFGSINVNAFSDELISLYRNEFTKFGPNTRLCRHFHIPLQSGSDKILKLIGRKYSLKQYLKGIKKLRLNIPGVTISTDIIVGFPGETEKDFQITLQAIKQVKFIKVHLFRFSPRKGTLAEKMIREKKWSKVDPKIIKNRADKARKISHLVWKKEILKFTSHKLSVLFERKSQPGAYQGYSDNFLRVKKFSKENLIGNLKTAKIPRRQG